MWQGLLAALECARPVNQLLVGFAVLLGGVLAGAHPLAPDLLLAALATLLALGAGNIWNDLADLREDRINRPARPLPSGRLRPAGAASFSGLLLLGSLAASRGIHSGWLLFVLSCLLLLGWYAWRGKQAGLKGNTAIALLSSLSVLFGALASSPSGVWRAVPAALLAGCVHLGREWAKDLQDLDGDRAAGRRTWVMSAGAKQVSAILRWLMAGAGLVAGLAAALPGQNGLRLAHLLAALLLVGWSLRAAALDLDAPGVAATTARNLKLLLTAGLAVYSLALMLLFVKGAP